MYAPGLIDFQHVISRKLWEEYKAWPVDMKLLKSEDVKNFREYLVQCNMESNADVTKPITTTAFVPLYVMFIMGTDTLKTMLFSGIYKDNHGRYSMAVLKFTNDYLGRFINTDHMPAEILFGRQASDLNVGPQLHRSAFKMHDGNKAFVGVITAYAGLDLMAYTTTVDNITPTGMLCIIRAVCNHIITLKGHGIAHGDIKLENVCVTRLADNSYAVKLIDYGMSRWLTLDPTQCSSMTEPTTAHRYTGTRELNPPEKKYDFTCDCSADPHAENAWWLGLIVWELLTGHIKHNEMVHPTHAWEIYRLQTDTYSETVSGTVIVTQLLTIAAELLRQQPQDRLTVEKALERINTTETAIYVNKCFTFYDTYSFETTHGAYVMGDEHVRHRHVVKSDFLYIRKLHSCMCRYVSDVGPVPNKATDGNTA